MPQTLLVVRDYLDSSVLDKDLPFHDGNEGAATIMRMVIEHYFTGWDIEYVSLSGHAKKMSVSKLRRKKKVLKSGKVKHGRTADYASMEELLAVHQPDKVI
mgnify:CR=1 FL=1